MQNSLKNKNILVTGATGFIGKSLISKLRKSGFQVIGIDIKAGKIDETKIFSVNLLKQKQIEKFFKKNQFNAIVHLAARVPKSDDLSDQKLSLLKNTASTLNILEAFKTSKTEKFIYASGISVVGIPPNKKPIDELSLPNPESLYVAGKYFGEILCDKYRKETGKKIITCRIAAPYGPGLNKLSVIPLFIERALSDKDISIYGSGKRSQDFIYISDVVRAILAAIEHNCQGIYNIASGEQTSTLDLAKIILKNIPETKSKITFSKHKDPQENYRVKVNISKAKKDLNFSPEVMIEKGIKKYIEYFKEN